MKKFLSIILSMVLLVAFAGCSETSNDNNTVQKGNGYYLYYRTHDGKNKHCSIFGFRNEYDYFAENVYGSYGSSIHCMAVDGDGGNIVIPEKIDGYDVTDIDGGAFNGCSSIDSIELPDTIEDIENGAFDGCKIDLNIKGTTHSAADAFSKKSGICFNGENRIKDGRRITFYYSETDEGLEITGYECNGITSGNTNTTIKADFLYCYIGGDLFQTISISPKINNKVVTSIASNAFENNIFDCIIIPKTVKKIGANAFSFEYGDEWDVSEFDIPSSLTLSSIEEDGVVAKYAANNKINFHRTPTKNIEKHIVK